MLEKRRGSAFPLVERCMSIRLDADLAALTPGRPAVVESERRLRKETSYGYLHALWWVWLEDGRSVISVPPGAGDEVRKIAMRIEHGEQIFEGDTVALLKAPLDKALVAAGLAPT